MSRAGWTFVWLLGAALASPAPPSLIAQKGASAEFATAPDGKRGFGSDLTQRDIDKLWTSKDEADRAFLDGLTQVSVEVRVAVLAARRHYFERGYFQTIAGSAGDDLALLHAAYAQCLAQPERYLAPGDARAQAFAAMLIDTRFNVRRGLLDQAELALRELERVRAVFGATVNGYSSLLETERQNVAARGDLAAAELRALRSDLEALQPGPADLQDSRADQDLRREILEIARLEDERMRREMMQTSLAPRRELERRMQGFLFSARVEASLKALRDWRARVLAAGAELRARTLAMTPDTPEGRTPDEATARLGKSERFREAALLAVEGLLSDPLDPELAWAAGHARAFASPGYDELIYMDRFLALSGLRYSDANPGQGRQLTPRELEAFGVIDRYSLK